MAEPTIEDEMKQTKEWFKSKINLTKEMHIRMDALSQSAPPHGSVPTYKAYLSFASSIYGHLSDIYELLDTMTSELYTRQRETSKLGEQLKRLNKIVKRPVFNHIDHFLKEYEQTKKKRDKWFKENR